MFVKFALRPVYTGVYSHTTMVFCSRMALVCSRIAVGWPSDARRTHSYARIFYLLKKNIFIDFFYAYTMSHTLVKASDGVGWLSYAVVHPSLVIKNNFKKSY